MIAVTGAAGFIGSCFVKTLNEKGYNDKDYEKCLAVVRRNRDYEDGWNDWYYGRYVRTFDE